MERAGRRGTCRDQGSLHLPVVYTRQPQARSALDAAGLAETLLVAAGGVSMAVGWRQPWRSVPANVEMN